MKRWSFFCILLFAGGMAALPSCAASENASENEGTGNSGGGTGCVPGQQTACACPGGIVGSQVCNSDGTGFDECQCGLNTGGGDVEGCGDYFCDDDADEDCHNCPKDCGICAPCEDAPKCENVTIPPTDVPHFEGLDVTLEAMPPSLVREQIISKINSGDPSVRLIAAALDEPAQDEHPFVARLREIFAENPEATAVIQRQLIKSGMPSAQEYRISFPEQRMFPESTYPLDVVPGGTVECGAPFLRFSIVQITAHEDYDDATDDVIYCIVTSEPTVGGGEILVTPPTQALDEGESFTGFTLHNGVFWGQTPADGCEEDVIVCGPRTPGGDLQITYDCLEQDNPDVYTSILDGISQATGALGGVIPGRAGWILLGVSGVSGIVSNLIGMDEDDYLFHAQHVVVLEDQLELTNGWYYSVRKSGSQGFPTSDWDWELFIKVWGCAEYGEKEL